MIHAANNYHIHIVFQKFWNLFCLELLNFFTIWGIKSNFSDFSRKYRLVIWQEHNIFMITASFLIIFWILQRKTKQDYKNILETSILTCFLACWLPAIKIIRTINWFKKYMVSMAIGCKMLRYSHGKKEWGHWRYLQFFKQFACSNYVHIEPVC